MYQMTMRAWQAALKASAGDDAESLWQLGAYYVDGVKTRSGKVLAAPDRNKAKNLFERPAALGSSSALMSLASLCSDALDTKSEMRNLRKALRLGESSAAYNLGICYRDLGCPRHAYQCYERTAAMGDQGAHLQLGLCQMLGYGVAQDFKLARKNFELALHSSGSGTFPRDREDAQFWLALLNLLGLVGRPQLRQARTWLLNADADGDHEAAGLLLNVIGRKAKRMPASRDRRKRTR